MKNPLVIGCFAVGVLLLGTAMAYGQQGTKCGPRPLLLMGLATKYQEVPRVMALSNDGTILEIISNSETGTWTALRTRPDGISCMFTAGEGFDILNEPEPVIPGDDM